MSVPAVRAVIYATRTIRTDSREESNDTAPGALMPSGGGGNTYWPNAPA
jgi:hypothetical protein